MNTLRSSIVRVQEMFDQYEPELKKKLFISRAYSNDKPERKIKCPQCGYFLCKAYGTEHYCVSVMCNKCKFKEVIDLALFRTMKLKQIYNEKEGYWYVPSHGEIPA